MGIDDREYFQTDRAKRMAMVDMRPEPAWRHILHRKQLPSRRRTSVVLVAAFWVMLALVIVIALGWCRSAGGRARCATTVDAAGQPVQTCVTVKARR